MPTQQHLSSSRILTSSTTADLLYPSLPAPTSSSLPHFFLLALSHHASPYDATSRDGRPPLLIFLENKLDTFLKKREGIEIQDLWHRRLLQSAVKLISCYATEAFFSSALFFEYVSLSYADGFVSDAAYGFCRRRLRIFDASGMAELYPLRGSKERAVTATGSVGWMYLVVIMRQYLSDSVVNTDDAFTIKRRKVVRIIYFLASWSDTIQHLRYLTNRSPYYSISDLISRTVAVSRKSRAPPTVHPRPKKSFLFKQTRSRAITAINATAIVAAPIIAFKIFSKFRLDVARRRLQDTFASFPPTIDSSLWVPPPPPLTNAVNFLPFYGICGRCGEPWKNPTACVGTGRVYCAQCINIGGGRTVRLLGI
uniref:Pex N-terminal domain-containing protein n=2 Tax=Corethron hystrix TaxID=216773 RepID=A0A7S1FT76_9STRA|mmetsp:Transcript_29825/g.68439  ORF Transcript_29825/g.68439 Transcript_29825/m.68439 type:complete len:367 (+) Transcript_29825:69-1169(+)